MVPDAALIDAVREQNRDRSTHGEGWSLGVYWLIGVGMCCQAVVLASVLAWTTPPAMLRALPHHQDVRYALFYWLYPILLLGFLITAGAGAAGWAVVGTVYAVAAIGAAVYGQCKVWHGSDHGGPDLDPDGSISDKQLEAERESIAAYKAAFTARTGEAAPGDTALRVAHMVARYNPDRLPFVDDMLENYRHSEQHLLVDLERKYGPAPQLSELDAAAREGAAARQAMRLAWRRRPFPMAHRQLLCATLLPAGSFVALVVSIVLLLFLAWTPAPYWVIRRVPLDVDPGGGYEVVVEPEQPMPTKASHLMYAWQGLATDLRLSWFVSAVTRFCGSAYTDHLASQADRETILHDWIQPYDVDMSAYDPSDWRDYSSVNEWLIRRLRNGTRPLADENAEAVLSPVDGRTVVFPNVTTATDLWIKGGRFTWQALLGNEPVLGDPLYFEGGAVLVSRLARGDYHRFHAPCHASVMRVRPLAGTMWSTGPEAVGSGNDVLFNQRVVTLLDAGPTQGVVAMVAVGSTCSGSVQMKHEDGTDVTVGDDVAPGGQLGYFQFGGSTVVMLFRRGAFRPSCDVAEASARGPVETLLRYGMQLGAFTLHQQDHSNGGARNCVP